MPNKKNAILSVTIILTIVITIIGISYSYFSNDIINDGINSTTSVNTVNLNVTYHDKKNILLNNLKENDTYIKNIFIENTSNYDLRYNIQLENIMNTFNASTLVYNVKINDDVYLQNVNITNNMILNNYIIGAHEKQMISIFINVLNYNETIDSQAIYRATLSVNTLE